LVDRAARGFGGAAGRLLAWRPAVYLGAISYGVYLYHLPVLWVARGVAKRLGGSLEALPPAAQFVLLSGVSIALAAASWELFESRINRYKDRVPALRPEPAPGVAALGR
ncbi:MAG TPA: acyltransferase family protein, partial [Longimicrobiaceae bacterium]|nr:acyltransferase family protein [Longimicrobiaceae bacterium]